MNITDIRTERKHAMPRTVLVHLNVELPDNSDTTAAAVTSHIDDALTVGLEGRPDGALTDAAVMVAYSEEV